MDSDSNEMLRTPSEMEDKTNIVTLNKLLPMKSRSVYEHAYRKFIEWQQDNKISSFTENVILSYLADLSTKIKPSTLWSQYSMLKTTLNVNNGVNIGKYSKIIPYLKLKCTGYRSIRSKTLKKEEIDRFICEAPDREYLMFKVALIFGLAGTLTREELSSINIHNVNDLGSSLLIKLPLIKSDKPNSFTITDGNYLKVCRKYIALRPRLMNHSKFFIKYANGKCHKPFVGIHKLATTAQEVAAYLKLPNIQYYTGRCLRETSATLLVNSEEDIIPLKRYTKVLEKDTTSVKSGTSTSSNGDSNAAKNSKPMVKRSFISAISHRAIKNICRLCLNSTAKNKILQNEIYLRKIKLLMPNFNNELVYNPVICHTCSLKLQMASDFVEQCMASQKLIQQYKDTYGLSQGMISCEDVLRNKTQIPSPKIPVSIASQNVKKRKIAKPSPPKFVQQQQQQQSSESHDVGTDVAKVVNNKKEAFDEFENEDKFKITSNDVSNIKQEMEEILMNVATDDGGMSLPKEAVKNNQFPDYCIKKPVLNPAESSSRGNVSVSHTVPRIGTYNNVPTESLVTETFVSSGSPMTTSSFNISNNYLSVNYQNIQNR